MSMREHYVKKTILPLLSWTWGCWAPVTLPAGNPIRCLSDWAIHSGLDPGSPPLVCRGLRREAWVLCPAAQCYWAMAAGRRAWSACRWDGWWGNVGSPLHKKKKIEMEWIRFEAELTNYLANWPANPFDCVLRWKSAVLKGYLRRGAGWALGTCWPAEWRAETGWRCTRAAEGRVFRTGCSPASALPSVWSTHTASTPAPVRGIHQTQWSCALCSSQFLTLVKGNKEDVRVMKYLHQLHGDLIYFPAGVWGLE